MGEKTLLLFVLIYMDMHLVHSRLLYHDLEQSHSIQQKQVLFKRKLVYNYIFTCIIYIYI